MREAPIPEARTPGTSGLIARWERTASVVRVLAPRELRVRYRQSMLNIAWAIVNPVVVLVVYGLVLVRSFGVSSSCGTYLASAWTGVVPWTFFATAVGWASHSMVGSSDLLSKLYFPRESIPLAVVVASLVDLGVGMVTVLVVGAFGGAQVGIASMAMVLPLAVLIVWTAAVSIVVGVLAAFSRDVIHAVNLVLRVGFFATPVMFEEGFLPSGFAWAARLNPVAVAITGLRRSFLCGQPPSVTVGGAHLAAGVVALFAAVLYTRSVEARLADVI